MADGLRMTVVGVQRPIFRGDKQAVWRASRDGLRDLLADGDTVLDWRDEPITDADAAANVASELVADPPDFLLIQATTFATADLFRPLLDLDVPAGLWAVPEPGAAGPLPLNSLCGVNFLLSLPHGGERVKWFYGLPNDDTFKHRLRVTLCALQGLRAVRRGKILAVGGTAPTFERFAVDAGRVRERLGTQVESVGLEALFERTESFSDAAVAERAEAMGAEAQADRLTAAQRLPAARIDLALESLGRDGGYGAMALRCWPECADRVGAMPCAAVARRFDAGCPTACEGDVLGAISLLALRAMTGREPILMDLSHVERDALLFWHCGNGPRELADQGGIALEPHFNRPDTGAVRAMRLAPGPTTMLRLLNEPGGREPLAAAVFDGRWSRRSAGFDGVCGWLNEVRWNGQQRLGVGDLLATVFDRRLPHHFAFGAGHVAEAAVELAGWLGLALIEPSRWRDEMRPEGER